VSEAIDGEKLTLRQKLESLYRVAVYRPQFAVSIIILSIFAAVLEGIGLSFLIPVIEIAQGGAAGGSSSDIGAVFVTAYDVAGIPFTLETVVLGVALVMAIRYTASFS
jgi:subfamily B ATP-binding cassette protein MsbA